MIDLYAVRKAINQKIISLKIKYQYWGLRIKMRSLFLNSKTRIWIKSLIPCHSKSHQFACLQNKRECLGQKYEYQCISTCRLKDNSHVVVKKCEYVKQYDNPKRIPCGKEHPILSNSRAISWMESSLTEKCNWCGSLYVFRWENCSTCNIKVWESYI